MHYLYEMGESRVFALLVLDELQRLTLLTAEMGHLLLKLISSLSLKLTHTQIQHVSYASQTKGEVLRKETLTLASMMSPIP